MKKLQSRYICPSCWENFRPEEILWIATSEELLGEDDRLSNYDYKRFLPRHFTPDCHAIDERGGICRAKACPNCHLEIPDAYFEAEPFFTTIVGGQSSGKSYFLVSLARWLKQQLTTFGLHCEAVPKLEMNQRVNERIKMLFTKRKTGEVVALEGDKLGANATNVKIPRENAINKQKRINANQDGKPVEYDVYEFALPLMYSMISTDTNSDEEPLYGLCLYDHSGEDFEPGEDHPRKPLTKHIGSSHALLFLLDPTQDHDFVEAYKPGYTNKDLVGSEAAESSLDNQVKRDPHIVFTEMVRRIRADYKTENGEPLGQKKKYDKPIIVVVTKCDAWEKLLTNDTRKALEEYPILPGDGTRSISRMTIKKVNDDVKNVIQKYFPEFVGTVDRFGSDVVYIPVSATGWQPLKDADGNEGYIPGTLNPKWIGVPFLYALAKHKRKLVEIDECVGEEEQKNAP